MWRSGQTAVVGLAAGNFDFLTARRHVGTLRMTGYCDTIVWGVTDELEPEARKFLLANKVTLVTVPVGPCASEEYGKKCSSADNKVPLALYRFDWYKEQLNMLQSKRGMRDDARVLFTDTRDSFFQANPFHNPAHPDAALSFDQKGQDVATFLEFAEFPIKKESINNGWIEGCFGRGKEGLLAPWQRQWRRFPAASCNRSTVAGNPSR